MTKRRHAPILALVGALLAACSGAAMLETPRGEPYAVGTLDSITHRQATSLLLVRALPGSPEPCGIAATVNRETTYLRRDPAGAQRRIALADLTLGDTVEVYVYGAVAESCPPQGYANVVILLR